MNRTSNTKVVPVVTTHDNLYTRFGGEAVVASCVEEFYDRVLADIELAPFFAQTRTEELFQMQREFFTVALDGPATYSGMDLWQAHVGRGIKPAHLALFTGHLMDTLRARAMSESDIETVLSRIAIHSEDITGNPTSDG